VVKVGTRVVGVAAMAEEEEVGGGRKEEGGTRGVGGDLEIGGSLKARLTVFCVYVSRNSQKSAYY